jgi:nicotinate-nucleotide pyrophosphorylase (carboxylating)
MGYNKIIIERKLKEFLEEDCPFQDVSSKIIPETAEGSAQIFVKSDGFISGLEELKIVFEILNVATSFFKNDGDKVKKGEVILELKGRLRNILLGERVSLNLLTYMSSVTSTVRGFVKIIEDSGKNIKIACTRKTHPGLRIFEKKATELGGGDSHRFSLSDMVLLKDTHLRYYKGDVRKMLEEIKKQSSFSKKIEIEIEKVNDVIIAAENGADIIMLDNMSPDMVKKAIDLLKENNLRKNVAVEVSGGVSLGNIRDYLIAEPDIISIGDITQYPSIKMDFSLRFS